MPTRTSASRLRFGRWLQGISNSPNAKLQNALAALNAARTGDVTSTCNQMNAFINNVQAQSGKSITTAG